jgi:hypothetical protein
MSALDCADRANMKALVLVLFLLSFSALGATGIKGVVSSPEGCSSPVMVWVSLDKEDYKERLLLMHTEVPVGGSFQFYLKPGNYQLRASDQKGCEYFKRILVKGSVLTEKVKMVKK